MSLAILIALTACCIEDLSIDAQSSPTKASLNQMRLTAAAGDREGEFAVKMLQVQAAEIAHGHVL
jgi:hypothetical protein